MATAPVLGKDSEENLSLVVSRITHPLQTFRIEDAERLVNAVPPAKERLLDMFLPRSLRRKLRAQNEGRWAINHIRNQSGPDFPDGVIEISKRIDAAGRLPQSFYFTYTATLDGKGFALLMPLMAQVPGQDEFSRYKQPNRFAIDDYSEAMLGIKNESTDEARLAPAAMRRRPVRTNPSRLRPGR